MVRPVALLLALCAAPIFAAEPDLKEAKTRLLHGNYGEAAASFEALAKAEDAIIDDQVRNLRKRWLIDDYEQKRRTGTYWGIRTNIADYKLNLALPAPYEKTLALAETPTRLKALPEVRQNQLMNWGYAVCDAALRKHMTNFLPAGTTVPAQFPFTGGVG